MTWTLSIDALNAAGDPVTLRFAQGRYDDPGGHFWDPRILQPGLYDAGLFAGDLLSQSRSGFGETTLVNVDGGLDHLADYAVDGRDVVLALDGVTMLAGTAVRLEFGQESVSVVLRDPLEPLMTPHPMEAYDGSNVLPDGLEGTEDDIAGEPKPQVWGEVRNATPVQVNTSKLIYQVSSLADCTVTAVYDKGSPLTDGGAYASLSDLESTAPASGEFRAYQGYVRIGTGAAGTLTVDATQSTPTLGAVAAGLASARGWTLNASDAADLDAFGAVRLYLTSETDTMSLLDELAVSVGGYVSVDATGELRMGELSAPGSPVATLHDYQIVDIQRSATGAGPQGLPTWRVRVDADRIETVQTDLAGNVGDARRARLARQTRRAIATDTVVQDDHPLAGEIDIASRLGSLAAAQGVADRVQSLLSVRRDTVTIDARVEDVEVEIGTTVRVITPRLGYSLGRDMIVTGYSLNAETGDISINLWG